MFKTLQRSLHQSTQFLGQNWLIALCIAIFVGIIAFGAPAWAAPVTQGGTVPDPTATSEGNLPATATPQPDDDGEDGDGGSPVTDPDSGEPVDPNAPNIIFPTGTPSAPGAPAANLTASVTVAGLNVREGPGTNFNALGNMPANTQVTLLSRSEDGAWWYVCCLPGTETRGWVSAQLLTPNFDAAQANTLIPVFGTTPAAPTAAATPVPSNAGQSLPQAELPLSTDFRIQPFFVWQGITATLTITVNNPNTVDAVNVLLSDELPEALTFASAEADANGTVETVTTADNRQLLLFRWATIPADTAATATIVAVVSPNLPDGTVIDNLIATRASNVPYSTGFVTIGLPPILPPDFQ